MHVTSITDKGVPILGNCLGLNLVTTLLLAFGWARSLVNPVLSQTTPPV